MKWIVLFVLLTVPFLHFAESLQCMDEKNEPVDWFIMYKIPHRKKGGDNKMIKRGAAYLYISSADIPSWQLSTLSVNDSNSFLANTLEPLYDQDKNKDLLHVLYNDEAPNKNDNNKKGHTKGIVVGNEDGGYWIVHSVPLFPPPSDEQYSYPMTGTVYGQSVLCMSFDAQNLDSVGTQLMYNQPEIYSNNMPDKITSKFPTLYRVMQRDTVVDPPFFHTLQLKSRGGTDFLSFAKTKHFMKDLYEDWVAPHLHTDLLVQSWLNGPGILPSDCSKPYTVKNIVSINLEPANFTYKAALDHSKWAVANSTETNWICIGDINRAEHQKTRGGGTVCFNNQKIAQQYRNTVNAVENCAQPEFGEREIYGYSGYAQD